MSSKKKRIIKQYSGSNPLTKIHKNLDLSPELNRPTKRKRNSDSIYEQLNKRQQRQRGTSPYKYALCVTRIEEFTIKHKGILQHTPEWYDLIPRSIGGSELAVLLNMNPYTKRGELLKAKKYRKPFVVSKECDWGNFFEPILREIVECWHETKIYGHDITIVDGETRLSPDGLSPQRGCIVLYELKCPYKRHIDDNIPKLYKPQLWAGLIATDGLTDYAIYVDAVFRKCKYADLNNSPKYDKEYHYTDKGYQPYKKPVAWGLINIYSKEKVKRGYRLIDYGKAVGWEFNGMLRSVSRGDLSTSLNYVKFEKQDMLDILKPQYHPEMYLVGYLPFKLMDIRFIKETRHPFIKKRDLTRWVKRFFDDVDKLPNV